MFSLFYIPFIFLCREKAEEVEFCQAMAMEPNGHRKGSKKSTVTRQNGDHSTLNIEDELDPWTSWANKPHTITLLFIGACLLM